MMLFAGRLHIVLLHLPIGFLVLMATLELLSIHPKWRRAALSNRFILWLTAPVAVLTAACGWLLAGTGGYDERLLCLHRWTGVGVAAAACLMLWVYLRGWISLYRGLLLVGVGLTLIAGHFGASLTHGSDFLRRYAPFWLGGRSPWAADRSKPETLSNAAIAPTGILFRTEHETFEISVGSGGYGPVQTVFADYCVSCHGLEKSKGGLRLDSLAHVLAGGDSGPALVAGDASGSRLLNRILLPIEDDDHMPPEGKPQPSAGDLQLIRNWILSGALE